MDFFHEVQLDAPQAEAMARGLYAVAKSDGIHVREAALVSSFYAETGASERSLAELERRPLITGAELASVLTNVEERRLFLKTALLLAWTDGVVSPQEQKIVGDFAAALGVSREELTRLDVAVKEYLLAHLAHVKNVEATRQVAQKLSIS
jgi:tellurite resistance protein